MLIVPAIANPMPTPDTIPYISATSTNHDPFTFYRAPVDWNTVNSGTIFFSRVFIAENNQISHLARQIFITSKEAVNEDIKFCSLKFN